MKDKTVDEVMIRSVRTISPEQSMADVKEIFESEGFRHLLVAQFDELKGIVSRTDLMRITYGAEIVISGSEGVNNLIYESTTVGDIMSTKLKTIESGAPLSEAARIMMTYQISAVPVVDNGELLGILTSSDILKEYVGLFHQ